MITEQICHWHNWHVFLTNCHRLSTFEFNYNTKKSVPSQGITVTNRSHLSTYWTMGLVQHLTQRQWIKDGRNAIPINSFISSSLLNILFFKSSHYQNLSWTWNFWFFLSSTEKKIIFESFFERNYTFLRKNGKNAMTRHDLNWFQRKIHWECPCWFLGLNVWSSLWFLHLLNVIEICLFSIFQKDPSASLCLLTVIPLTPPIHNQAPSE